MNQKEKQEVGEKCYKKYFKNNKPAPQPKWKNLSPSRKEKVYNSFVFSVEALKFQIKKTIKSIKEAFCENKN